MSTFRFLLICAGAWLAAVEPAVSVAEVRQAANLASGHMPNMDPGIMVSMTWLLTMPILFVLLVVELSRWAINGKTLALPSYFLLGAMVACPVGCSIVTDVLPTNSAIYAASVLMLATFYLVRWAWMKIRTRGS